MIDQNPDKTQGWRGSPDLWLDAAHQALVSGGVDAVKIMPLAKALGLSRTSFYWHFADRDALLAGIVDRWKAKNTGNLVARCNAPAASICAGVYNLFDCWIDARLFDAKLDLAIRNWGQNDTALRGQVDAADATRIAAISDMFQRFDYTKPQARTRAHTMIFTQVGYYAMQLDESLQTRLARMPPYVEVFTGHAPTNAETAAFLARHAPLDAPADLA